MTRILFLFGVLFLFFGCASEQAQDPMIVPPAPAEKTRAAEIISELKGGESEARAGITDMKLKETLTDELAALGPKASGEILAVMSTRSESSSLRLTLMDAIYKMDDRRAVPYFIHMLNDDSESIREKARFILENFTGVQFHMLTAASPGAERNRGIAEWVRWWDANRNEWVKKYGELPYNSSWDSVPAE